MASTSPARSVPIMVRRMGMHDATRHNLPPPRAAVQVLTAVCRPTGRMVATVCAVGCGTPRDGPWLSLCDMCRIESAFRYRLQWLSVRA
eukprot:6508693-Prymnesium_polylepis.2